MKEVQIPEKHNLRNNFSPEEYFIAKKLNK